MDKKKISSGLVLLLLTVMGISAMAVSSSSVVSDLLEKTGLSFSPVNGRADSWFLTYTGLENLDELDVYVWARKTSYVTVFATAFSFKEEPSKAFLWRLLEFNDSMLPFKYVIREDKDNGGYLVDCQADLPLKSLGPKELRECIDNLVSVIDDNYQELKNLI